MDRPASEKHSSCIEITYRALESAACMFVPEEDWQQKISVAKGPRGVGSPAESGR